MMQLYWSRRDGGLGMGAGGGSWVLLPDQKACRSSARDKLVADDVPYARRQHCELASGASAS